MKPRTAVRFVCAVFAMVMCVFFVDAVKGSGGSFSFQKPIVSFSNAKATALTNEETEEKNSSAEEAPFSLSSSKLMIAVGENTTLTFNFVNKEYQKKAKIKWVSENEEIATVSSGKITALKEGSVQIHCEAVTPDEQTFTASCEVNVYIPIESVEATVEKEILFVGEAENINLIFAPENAYCSEIIWTSNNPETLSVSDTGTITALAPGKAEIRAEINADLNERTAKFALMKFEVVQPAEQVKLDNEKILLAKAKSTTVDFQVLPENATFSSLTWTSEDETIATVKDGQIKGISAGKTHIVCIVENVDGQSIKAYCDVEIYEPVDSAKIQLNELTICTGNEETLECIVQPQEAYYKDVIWESSASDIVSVDKNGVIHALKAGSATITATTTDPVLQSSSNYHPSSCKITVIQKAQEIVLEQDTLLVPKGGKIKLSETVLPEDTTDSSVSWVAEDSSLAEINGHSLAAKEVGETILICSTEDGSGIQKQCKLIVFTPVSSVDLMDKELELSVGGSEKVLQAVIAPENAYCQTVSWLSDNEEVATVNENGTVTAKKAGKAVITATSNDIVLSDGKEKSASCKVTVIQYAEQLQLNLTEMELPIKGKAELEAIILPEDTTDKTVVWESSNEDIVTVKDGKLTGVGLGNAVVSCKLSLPDGYELYAYCDIHVFTPVKNIKLSDAAITLQVTEQYDLTATAAPEDAYYQGVVWSSDNDEVALVDENGSIQALKAGTAVITATSTEISVSGTPCQASCKVTVLQPVEEIVLEELTIDVGQQQKLDPYTSVLPADASNPKVNWYSTDETIATVSKSGVVTGKKKGTCKIICESTDGSNITGEASLTVVQLAKKIELPESVTILNGQTDHISISVLPKDTSNKQFTTKVLGIAVAEINNAASTIALTGKFVGATKVQIKAKDRSAISKILNVYVEPEEPMYIDSIRRSGKQLYITRAVSLCKNSTISEFVFNVRVYGVSKKLLGEYGCWKHSTSLEPGGTYGSNDWYWDHIKELPQARQLDIAVTSVVFKDGSECYITHPVYYTFTFD